MSEAEQLQRKIKNIKTDADCFAVAKAIYGYLEKHKGCALENKTVTFTVPVKLDNKSVGVAGGEL